MIYLVLLSAFLWLVLVSLAGLGVTLARFGDPDVNRIFARMYSFGMRALLRIRVTVEGAEHLSAHQPCIYVGNHQSNVDMTTYGAMYPGRTIVIGKKEIRYLPVFGLFFRAGANVMIDRSNREKSVASLDRAVEALRRKGHSIWIFPEGTRNKSGRGLLPFKKGAFHMAIAAQVPIVPIVTSPMGEVFEWRTRHWRAGTVRIRVLEPVMTAGLAASDVDALSARVRERMLEGMRGLGHGV